MKKIILCIAVFFILLSVTGCFNDDERTSDAKQQEVYNQYLEYTRLSGEKALSYEEWLASIKGQKGDKGADGHTPKIAIGINGNWFIDDVDTGVKATATDGENGKDGSTWITGEGAPTESTIAKQGDMYLDILNKKIYLKESNSWTKIMNIESQLVKEGSNWQSGNNAPTNSLEADNGDMYLDVVNRKIYVKENNEWKLVGVLQNEQETQVVTQHEIIYYLDGGTNSTYNVSRLNEGDSLTLFEPTKYAYIFDGWYDTPNFENEITKIENISSTTVLFAKWKINEEYFEGFPMISINTQNGVLPYDKETYINASFSISNCENEEHNFDVSMKGEYGDDDSVGIRLRGNSTSYYPKKPYRIKFDKKKSLLGLQKNKSWVLLADYLDNSSIRNYTAFTLAQKFESLDFSPSPNHVVLFLNGEYQGLYLLTEQIDENDGRTAVEEDFDVTTDTSFPFLVEMDRNAIYEGITGVDNFRPNYFWPIEIKYPEYEDRGIEEENEDIVFSYINNYINAAFTSLVTGESVEFNGEIVSFEDLVDVDSFIEYWLVNGIMRNEDSTWGSIYMSKTKDGKLKFGPVWDFDYSMSSHFWSRPYPYSEIHTAYEFCILIYDTPLYRFVQNEDNFNLVVKKWDQIKSKILEVVEELRLYKNKLSEIGRQDANYWYGETGAFQFDMQYDYVRLFLLDRYNFLDSVFKEGNHEWLLSKINF